MVPFGSLGPLVKVLLILVIALLEKFFDKNCENFSIKGGYNMKNKVKNIGSIEKIILKAINKTIMSMLLVKL